MPREDRRIVFSNEEVYKAIYSLSTQQQLPKPPAGILKSVEQSTVDKNIYEIKLENPAQDVNETREYGSDFIAAALMMFCRGAGIPLPRSAQKSVMIRDGEVILRVQI